MRHNAALLIALSIFLAAFFQYLMWPVVSQLPLWLVALEAFAVGFFSVFISKWILERFPQ